MRFQDLILSLSSLPTGSRFQDHLNNINTSGSAGLLSANISNHMTSSIETNNSANLVTQDLQVSVGNTITINATNQLNDL